VEIFTFSTEILKNESGLFFWTQCTLMHCSSSGGVGRGRELPHSQILGCQKTVVKLFLQKILSKNAKLEESKNPFQGNYGQNWNSEHTQLPLFEISAAVGWNSVKNLSVRKLQPIFQSTTPLCNSNTNTQKQLSVNKSLHCVHFTHWK